MSDRGTGEANLHEGVQQMSEEKSLTVVKQREVAFYDEITAVQIAEAAYQSAATGQPVALS